MSLDGRARGSLGQDQAGVATLLFVALILPLSLVLLSVTFDLARFFSIRDEVQRLIDREVHDGVVRGLSSNEIVRGAQSRLNAVNGYADFSELNYRLSQSGGVLRGVFSVKGEYRGAFFGLVKDLTGIGHDVLPLNLRAQVRVQSNNTVILVDRELAAGEDLCGDSTLLAKLTFADRLTDILTERAAGGVVVGVFPGDAAPVTLLATSDLSVDKDGIRRCREVDRGLIFDAAAVSGAISSPYTPLSLAFAVRDVASEELTTKLSEVRSMVLLMGRERYDQGVAQLIYNLLSEQLSSNSTISLDLYVLAVDNNTPQGGAGDITNGAFESGINGGVFRIVGVTTSELSGVRLVASVAQGVTDRVVLEN